LGKKRAAKNKKVLTRVPVKNWEWPKEKGIKKDKTANPKKSVFSEIKVREVVLFFVFSMDSKNYFSTD